MAPLHRLSTTEPLSRLNSTYSSFENCSSNAIDSFFDRINKNHRLFLSLSSLFYPSCWCFFRGEEILLEENNNLGQGEEGQEYEKYEYNSEIIPNVNRGQYKTRP